jgi:hypothetical protein
MSTEDGVVRVGRWLLRPDVEQTIKAHSKLTVSGAQKCGCSGCANFDAARPQLLKGPLGGVLTQLGISPPWEVEVYELGRAAGGLHQYGGWFHFVGTIESGRGAWRSIGDGSVKTADFEPLSSTLSVGFHTDAAQIRPPFKGLPLVQLEISAELPWVIDAEEPT